MHYYALSCMLVAFAVRFVTPLSTAAKNAAIQTQAVQRTMSNRVAAQSLGGIDEVVGWKPAFYDTFLSTYFQKKPLLIRNAIHGLSTLDLQMGDFVDLAGDGDVETRIFQTENANIKKYAGPFEPKDIEKHMSKPGWSLLVQEMDRHVPQVADLWSSCFPFLPTWRRDDIMFSLSAPGGSIGAHVDNYDVFLLQGSGRRRWSIENAFLPEHEENARTVLSSTTKLLWDLSADQTAEDSARAVERSTTKLLRDFSADQAAELEAGDMLYLPPRVPHEGVTLGDKMGTTISFGLHAPNFRSLSMSLWDEIACCGMSAERNFYRDGADLNAVPHSAGSIADRAVHSIASRMQKMLAEKLADEEGFSDWLGKHLTDPLRFHRRGPLPFFLQQTVPSAIGLGRQLPYAVRSRHSVAVKKTFPSAEAVLRAVLAGECTLRRAEGVRFAYIGKDIFINGEVYGLPSRVGCSAAWLGRALCDDHRITPAQLQQLLGSAGVSPNSEQCWLLVDLLQEGFLYPAQL